MIAVDTDSMEAKLIPRSRQEIHHLVDENDRSVDRRLKKGHEELEIIRAETGEGYERYNDMRRVYHLVPERFTPEILREVKIKAYTRSEPDSTGSHADVSGGESSFYGQLTWEEFVKEVM